MRVWGSNWNELLNEKTNPAGYKDRAEGFEWIWRNESYVDVADSRTERVGNRRGERTREGVQHRVQHGTPPTLVSMATTTLERVIMQFPLFLFWRLFQLVPYALCSMWETKLSVFCCCRWYEKYNASTTLPAKYFWLHPLYPTIQKRHWA